MELLPEGLSCRTHARDVTGLEGAGSSMKAELSGKCIMYLIVLHMLMNLEVALLGSG